MSLCRRLEHQKTRTSAETVACEQNLEPRLLSSDGTQVTLQLKAGVLLAKGWLVGWQEAKPRSAVELGQGALNNSEDLGVKT